MKLINLLTEKKTPIVQQWLNLLYDSYPPETAVFLKKEKDHFDNPMGFGLSRGLNALYEALVQDQEVEQIVNALDEIIRIRALQDCSPSKALAFVFLLKNVVREELAEELENLNLAGELMELESHIDGLALLGFDVYTKRREKLTEIRVNEVKNRVSALLRRTGVNKDNL